MIGYDLDQKIEHSDPEAEVMVFNGLDYDGTPKWAPLAEVLLIDGQLHLAPEGWDE